MKIEAVLSLFFYIYRVGTQSRPYSVVKGVMALEILEVLEILKVMEIPKETSIL